MKLENLGYGKRLKKIFQDKRYEAFELGRVISEHKERYMVSTESGDYSSEIKGKLRYTADDRSSFPATGDWVAITIHSDNIAIIHEILPRFSILERKAVGKQTEKQIIATNIDYALIVLATDRDFSINRAERYLAICRSSDIKPIIVLSKLDLINQDLLEQYQTELQSRVSSVRVIAISNETQDGYEQLKILIEKSKTYCLLGSSGVGKSSLINNLAQKAVMDTAVIGSKTNRGKHATTHRELIVLNDGGILIDNPGMREVGIADAEEGLEATFNSIYKLSQQCKFRNCTHSQKAGCAVLAATEDGTINQESFDNYQQMERERAHYESSSAERRQKSKNLSKLVRQHKNNKQDRTS